MDYKEHLSNCDESQELLSLMEQKLPEYVTKCFLASGFDSEEAIACMDVATDGPGNSIKMEILLNSIKDVYSFFHYVNVIVLTCIVPLCFKSLMNVFHSVCLAVRN